MKLERGAIWSAIIILGSALFWLVRRQEELGRNLKALDANTASLKQALVERDLSEARKAKQEARVYFPEGAFDPDPVRDAVLADRYARPLRNLDLPSFLERAGRGRDPSNTAIRDPQFRLLATGPSGVTAYVLVYREVLTLPLGMQGGPHLVAKAEPPFSKNPMMMPMAFSAAQEAQFNRILKQSAFWTMPGAAKAGLPTADPKQERIVLEGTDGGKYHVVVREADAPAAWLELCRLIRAVAEHTP